VVGRGLHRTTGHDGTEDPKTLDIKHGVTLQHRFTFRKKRSLVLNGSVRHHGGMNTTQNTTKNRRVRTFMRYAWSDQVAAHRALLRLTPYFDRHRQDGR